MGTAYAAEDISTDVVSDSVDDAVVVDAIQEDKKILMIVFQQYLKQYLMIQMKI